MPHQPVQQPGDGKTNSNNQQPVGGIADAQQVDRSGEGLRCVQHQRLRAPDHADQFVGNQDQGEGGENLTQVVALIESAQQGDFKQQPDQGHPYQCRQQAKQK